MSASQLSSPSTERKRSASKKVPNAEPAKKRMRHVDTDWWVEAESDKVEHAIKDILKPVRAGLALNYWPEKIEEDQSSIVWLLR